MKAAWFTRSSFFDSVTFAGKCSQTLEVTSGISAFTQALNPFGARTVEENSLGWTVTRTTFVYTQVSNYKLINSILYIKLPNHALSISLGVRPYKCDTCEKEFNYLTTYKRHLNIHKGEKPFACEHCDKKFTRLNYLKNHLNTHAKHASQESQTDFKYDDSSSRQNMDVDNQEDLGTMEADSAAQSIQNEGKSLVENEAGKADTEGELQTEAVKEQEVF